MNKSFKTISSKLFGVLFLGFQGGLGKFKVFIDAPADVVLFLIGAVRIPELLIGTESQFKKFPDGFLDQVQLLQPFLLAVDGVDGIEDLEPLIGLTTGFSKFFGDKVMVLNEPFLGEVATGIITFYQLVSRHMCS